MANVAIGFGVAFIALGLVGYFATGAPTALIPAGIGVILVGLGMMARDPARRKLAMHIAVVVGLIGFLGSARGLAQLGAVLAGDDVARPAAVIAQSIMAILSLAFIWLCVKSFINARRNRTI
jgi:hypothetical protein